MMLLALLLALVPGCAWLFFYLQEDNHREPISIVFLAFLMGGFTALLALALEFGVRTGFNELLIPQYGALSVLTLALIEEAAKFWGAWSMSRGNPDFKEPVDAMIYMIIVSLGFATLENIGSIIAKPGTSYTLSEILATLSFRFAGATLLHTLTSGIVGYYWAVAIREFKTKRFIALGVIIAGGLHAVFNYFILTFGYKDLSISLIFLLILGLVVLGDFEKLKARTI